MQPTEILLFESPPPAKIRAVTAFSAAVLLFCLASSVFVLTHMTQDNGAPELAPLGWRVAMAVVITGIGAGFFAGMLFYLRVYVTRLVRIAGTDLLHVETLRLFGRHVRTVATGQVASTCYHDGKFAVPGEVSVEAPWYWVRVSGGRGFLLDAQGRFYEADVLGHSRL